MTISGALRAAAAFAPLTARPWPGDEHLYVPARYPLASMALETRQALPTAHADARRGTAPAATADMSVIAASDLEDGSEFEAWRPLLLRLGGAGPATQEVGDLVDQAATLWMRPGFDTFISLPRLRFTPFPYQLKAA